MSDWDQDSGIDEGEELSTLSLTSSTFAYPELHGRTFHAYKAGQYKFPNDEKEKNRLDLQHHLYNLVFGRKLHLAPISHSPQNVLDVGTGTGIWAMDFADQYLTACVT